MKYLIVIGGATATGKTATAIAVARHFQTEIISADSRQFYREMTVGTAKPSPEELSVVPHHFINSSSVEQAYSVGDFEREALNLLEVLFQKHDVAVLAGGSGLFIRALCEGLDEFPEMQPQVRLELQQVFENQGIAALQAELRQLDPIYFGQVDVNNPQRLIRALEVCRSSGKPFSSFQKSGQVERPFTPVYVLLQLDRAVLYEKINRRVDEMMRQGLLEEARQLFPFRHLNALQTVGYQELFEFLEGKISLEKAVELIKQNTRRYAKRQETWFRKDAHWKVFLPEKTGDIIDFVADRVGK